MGTDYATEAVATMATELEQLAVRLRYLAPRLTDGKRDSAIVAAELISEYVGSVGQIGTRLGDVVKHVK